MKVFMIHLALVLVSVNIILANPLLEGELTGRTLFQQNMKCNTKSAFKRITMTNSVVYDNNVQDCDYTIRAYNTRVCQVRIDFLYFDLQQPDSTATARPYAYCAGDYLRIDGLKFDLCGRLMGTHVYVPFDVKRITEELKIDFNIRSGSFATWSMEINQIECSNKAALATHDDRQAPDGCLQYFHQPSGRVESFNFGQQYYGDTRYAICFNRNNNEYAMLELSEITFSMDSINGDGFDGDCLDDDREASKDYIAIPFAEVTGEAPHSLFCGESLNDKVLTYTGTGPIVIHVNTDRITPDPDTETGFSFRYRISTYRP